MPRGIFLLVHDEITGPEIKNTFFENPVQLKQDFISKLYMSHAGFESSSHIAIKFENYRSVSCFTGNLDRRTQKEGIFGVIFEENEEIDNLDLFLQRNLYEIIDNPDTQKMEEIYSNQLLNYLKLVNLFKQVEIENIFDVSIVSGNHEFKYCPVKIGDDQLSTSEMREIYQKIIQNEKIEQIEYLKLEMEDSDNCFLVVKYEKLSKNIENIVLTLKSYIQNYYYYSLEILTLLLLPSVVKIMPLNLNLSKKYPEKNKSVFQNLKKAENYNQTFNEIILDLLDRKIKLLPVL
jgi:hypothetical protein